MQKAIAKAIAFCNDVCLRQMMSALPNDDASLMMHGFAAFNGKHHIIASLATERARHHICEANASFMKLEVLL